MSTNASTARTTAHQSLQHLQFPNETREYREARNVLLESEMELRRAIERVAEQRRQLPLGGEVDEFVFERADQNGRPESVRMSNLFDGHSTLTLYSFMFGPERDRPCPGCTHFLDSLDGAARHAPQRLSMYVVAKSPLARMLAWARDRGWRHLQFLSTAGNDYDRKYFGDSFGLSPAMRKQQDFNDNREWDMPILNVFRLHGGKVHHFWGSELLYVPTEPGQEYRHNDLLDPLWNLFDLTPEGRGDFHPRLDYRNS